jgi:hypothetical protein
MVNGTIDTPPTPIAAPAIDPFLIVISVIVVIVAFFFNCRFSYPLPIDPIRPNTTFSSTCYSTTTVKIVAYYLNPLDKGVAHFQKVRLLP